MTPVQAWLSRQTCFLPDHLAALVRASLEICRAEGRMHRLWARDTSLWTGADEGEWLGWLEIITDRQATGTRLRAIGEEVRSAGFLHALLLGMGGSSLCPEVVAKTVGRQDGYPELCVLDSTDPAQVRAFEARVDLADTIFTVSSKSGTTLESNIFTQYFFDHAGQVVGPEKAGSWFIAITDPDSTLHQLAKCLHFHHILFGLSSIGGRYSALSDFGLAPTAMMGVNPLILLNRAETMAQDRAASVPVEENPGVLLGTILGVLATQGRDKVTIIASPRIRYFGAWLEQLLAESTGKAGTRLIPVDRESAAPPEVYGTDRLFIYPRTTCNPDLTQDAALDALERAGAGGSDHHHRSLRPGSRVLPVGDRDHCGRVDPRDQPLQSAGCRSQQDRDANIDGGIRNNRLAPAGGCAGQSIACRLSQGAPQSTRAWRCGFISANP